MSNLSERPERFGEKLRFLRQQRGLYQREVAEAVGVSETYIGLMENGKKIPNIPMLLRIARLFEVTTDQLIRDDLELD